MKKLSLFILALSFMISFVAASGFVYDNPTLPRLAPQTPVATCNAMCTGNSTFNQTFADSIYLFKTQEDFYNGTILHIGAGVTQSDLYIEGNGSQFPDGRSNGIFFSGGGIYDPNTLWTDNNGMLRATSQKGYAFGVSELGWFDDWINMSFRGGVPQIDMYRPTTIHYQNNLTLENGTFWAKNVCLTNQSNCNFTGISGGGFNANQQVNTTSNVTFNFVNITRNLNVGNVSNTSNVMTVRGQKANNQNKTLVIQNETGGDMAIFASNGKLCLSPSGAQCNTNALTLQVQRNDNPDGLLVYVSSDTAANGAQFQFRKSRGNINSSSNPQAAVLQGDTVFSINVLPYDGAVFQTAAQIQAKIDAPNDTNKVPTGLYFNTAGQGSVATTKLYISSHFDNYFNGTLTTQNNITQINTPTTNIIGAGDTDVAGVFNSLLINGTTFDACSAGGCTSGNPEWTSAFAINASGTYFSGTTAGLTRTMTVQNTTLTTCTIAFTGGLYTGGTCR